MPVAVGTSLVVIAMKSFAGLAGYLTTVSPDWALVGAVTVAAVAGSFVGARLAGRIPEAVLRRGFGLFDLVMGVFVLVQELFGAAVTALGITAAAAGVAAVLCWFVVPRCPLRTPLTA